MQNNPNLRTKSEEDINKKLKIFCLQRYEIAHLDQLDVLCC